MTINSDEKKRYVRFSGRLDANTCKDLDAALVALGDGDITLDLSDCSYVSSAGIRTLLNRQKKMQPGHFILFVAGVVPMVFQVFEIAGLQHILHFEPGVDAALSAMQSRTKNKVQTTAVPGSHHHLVYQSTEAAPVPGQYCAVTEVLSQHELGYSFGFGELSGDQASEPGCHDFFAVLDNCIGFIPSGRETDADFRISSDPVRSGLVVCEALSFGHGPTGMLKLKEPGVLSFRQLKEGFESLCEEMASGCSMTLAVLANLDKDKPSLSLVLLHDAHLSSMIRENGLVRMQQALPDGGRERESTGITFQLSELTIPDQQDSLPAVIRKHLTFENITSVALFNSGMFLEDPVAWLFDADRFTDGRTQRLAIETKPGLVFEDHKAFLTRLLYSDSSKVLIEPLHGGYSAQTYHVTSYDHEGRKMRPTVLKVANRELISRESERCRQFALPYIFNNCAVVLGSEYHGSTMALRYNFVGIGGEAKQLKWLTHYYQHSEFDILKPIFDKIFLQILNPWYGQPVRKTIYPFRDHDPTLTFFPHLYKTAGDLLSISAEEEYITVPESDKPILNPYWFLKHEFSRRRDQGMEYLSGICHGDLNMQNILLDESMNVYLIDFSETKPRSVISDFARLEAILMIDNAPIEEEEDFAAYLNFIRLFYQIERLDDKPEIRCEGRHGSRVQKNVNLALTMRGYAFRSALENPDPVPYFLALLEWVLPIVCYTSLPLAHKRLSMMVSSILCGKITP